MTTIINLFQCQVQAFLSNHVLQDPMGERGWKDLSANFFAPRKDY